MNIYHLSRDAGEVDYDEYDAFIVAACSEEEARNYANENAAHEGRIWTDRKQVACKVVGRACSKVTAGVVLGSFKAG